MLTLHLEAATFAELQEKLRSWTTPVEATTPIKRDYSDVSEQVVEEKKRAPGRPKKETPAPAQAESGASSTPAAVPPGSAPVVVEAKKEMLATLENMRIVLREVVATFSNTDEGMQHIGKMIKDLTGKDRSSEVGPEQYGKVIDAAQTFLASKKK
jgi:hypothetical protein